MTLPRKVQEQAQRSDEMLEAMKNRQPDSQDTQEPQDPPAEVPQEPAQTPAPPAPVAETPPPEPTPPPAPTAPEPDAWERRYKTLEGKYRAEVPRLARQVKELQARNEELSADVDRMKSQPKAPAQPEAAGPDESMIDPDILAIIKANAMKAARDETQGLRPEVESMRAERNKRDAEARESQQKTAFISDLDELVPDWKDTDNDSTFHAWLADYDEHGNQRQEALMQAITGYNAARAASVFLSFARSRPSVTPPAPAVVAPPAHLQVPNRAGGQPPAAPKPQRIFTKSEIQSFYRDHALGKFTDEQVKEMEREIRSAAQEGRIR